MDKKDIANAKNPDLPASMDALRRASGLAIQTAIQTNTAIVIMENGKIVRISGEELKKKQSLRGSLKHYARPELIDQEKDAWPTVVSEEYEYLYLFRKISENS
ncbi:hypothetical protein [Synechococcus sp. PCC 6312]|uniref:hypothetical protein n=1 Tax=Synechococcus sp. (strain ATCC 27167 / PCC 6312) TaxID=195253 RepID=UPI00029ED1E4|nr:hypothetical protein [Synechococcus sp. PCC 6312]AFY60253.1 hypothetical protein Syn6312_1059 [Synechococcus sp. PCC 6312]